MTSETITAGAADTWKLGDLTVNRIGLGAMHLTSNADGTPIDRDRAVTVLRRALDLGVNHIDTAAFYAIAGQGREIGAGLTDDAVVVAIAAAHGVTAAQVRLAWTLQLGPHVLAIPGTGNPDHLVANVAAGALRLSPDDMRRLTSIQPAAQT